MDGEIGIQVYPVELSHAEVALCLVARGCFGLSGDCNYLSVLARYRILPLY